MFLRRNVENGEYLEEMNRVLYIYEGGNEVMEYVESFRQAKTSG